MLRFEVPDHIRQELPDPHILPGEAGHGGGGGPDVRAGAPRHLLGAGHCVLDGGHSLKNLLSSIARRLTYWLPLSDAVRKILEKELKE